ncbi:hypothetical protein M413DRAFT_112355 [Hebeloma cylindrosporum]|uniref:Uncharacterized protein n=1 Tax=Hebeloma cylindrosporum TaxID=76867 RepID=A0A0C3CLP3_HEBCY|nr:hypothetical protein M413DRAFT_112355 [Hebeloma cylindrosporum h7]
MWAKRKCVVAKTYREQPPVVAEKHCARISQTPAARHRHSLKYQEKRDSLETTSDDPGVEESRCDPEERSVEAGEKRPLQTSSDIDVGRENVDMAPANVTNINITGRQDIYAMSHDNGEKSNDTVTEAVPFHHVVIKPS